jgi:phage-associated protein
MAVMNSINDFADYIILQVKSEDKNASLINLKLQKLLYYVQAWSYGINKKAMFEGDFEAWIHGPVNREIYNRFSESKFLYSEIGIDDCLNKDVRLSNDDREFVDFILENYLKYSGAELEKLSHSEQPWIAARGDKGPNERCDTVISSKLMQEYYGKKWEEINNQ